MDEDKEIMINTLEAARIRYEGLASFYRDLLKKIEDCSKDEGEESR